VFLPCGDAHWEHECPKLHDGNNEDSMNFLDTMDPTCTISSQDYFNMTMEHLEQDKQEVARKARVEMLNQMDERIRRKGNPNLQHKEV